MTHPPKIPENALRFRDGLDEPVICLGDVNQYSPRNWIAEAAALKLATGSRYTAREAVKAHERVEARKARRQNTRKAITPENFASCKYCGARGLLWVNIQVNQEARKAWRLLGIDGKQHTCAESQANATLKAQIRRSNQSRTVTE